MPRFDQESLSDAAAGTHGDCTRAAIRTLLQDPLDGCPHPILPEDGWNTKFWDWLEERGIMLGHAPYRADKDYSHLPRVLLAAGPTVRTETTGASHMVVWDRAEMRCIHDPHPSRAGLLSVSWLYWLESHGSYTPLEILS